MSRVVILGMDGLDPDVLEKLWDDLPNFRRLRDQGVFTRTHSVFPADSVPAWATIYTGVMPDQHGILDSIDYLDISQKNFKCNTAGLKDNTFWDVAGAAGKRVCIINPFLAYPVWPVNGVMVNGPVFVSGDQQSYPESILTEYNVPELGGIVDIPTNKTLGSFAAKTVRLTEDHLAFALELFKREKWDLFFVNFLALDRIQHSFWRYCDPEDPTYPGKTEHSEVINDFYRLHDKMIGKFLDELGDDSILIVLSDHGHGRRCTKALYVNELLRQQGLLKANTSGGKLDPKYILERAKVSFLRFLDKYDLQDMSYKIAKFVPGAKALKKSTFVIDEGKSKAGVARFAGMNPFGGIDLPRECIQGDDEAYEALVARVMNDLKDLKDPKTGRNVVQWVKRREEMFRGPYADIYPEVVFKLDSDYGVSRSLFGPLIDINPTHKKISGGHMPEAVFLTNRKLPMSVGEGCSVQAIAPIVLQLLGVDVPEHMDGYKPECAD